MFSMTKLFFALLFVAGSAFADETVMIPYAEAKSWLWSGDHWVFITNGDQCFAQVRFLREGTEAVQISCRSYGIKPRRLFRERMTGPATIDKLEGRPCLRDGRSSIGCTQLNDPK
jgi:hypothetical protein